MEVQKCSPQSVQLNSVINTFMDHQKLTLSAQKKKEFTFSLFRFLTFDTHMNHCVEGVEAETEAGLECMHF